MELTPETVESLKKYQKLMTDITKTQAMMKEIYFDSDNHEFRCLADEYRLNTLSHSKASRMIDQLLMITNNVPRDSQISRANFILHLRNMGRIRIHGNNKDIRIFETSNGYEGIENEFFHNAEVAIDVALSSCRINGIHNVEDWGSYDFFAHKEGTLELDPWIMIVHYDSCVEEKTIKE